jgi:hypothetical protein
MGILMSDKSSERTRDVIAKLKELQDDQYREPEQRCTVEQIADIAEDAIIAIRMATTKYHDLYSVVYAWCVIQEQHPGALPDVKALREALDKRKP